MSSSVVLRGPEKTSATTARDPHRFDPDRFDGRAHGAFDMVPQSGGDHTRRHRCPGRAVVDTVLHRSLPLLLAGAVRRAAAPGQDLTVHLSCVPALPRSGSGIEEMRAVPTD